MRVDLLRCTPYVGGHRTCIHQSHWEKNCNKEGNWVKKAGWIQPTASIMPEQEQHFWDLPKEKVPFVAGHLTASLSFFLELVLEQAYQLSLSAFLGRADQQITATWVLNECARMYTHSRGVPQSFLLPWGTLTLCCLSRKGSSINMPPSCTIHQTSMFPSR